MRGIINSEKNAIAVKPRNRHPKALRKARLMLGFLFLNEARFCSFCQLRSSIDSKF